MLVPHRILACFLLLIIIVPSWAEETASAVSPERAAEAADIDELYRQGSAAYDAKDYALAIKLAEKIIKQTPDVYRGYWLRAIARAVGFKDYESAVADLEQVHLLAPGYAGAWGSRGWYLILMGRFQEARIPTEKAQALDPTLFAWTLNLGHTYLLQGDRDNAMQWYRKSLPLIQDRDALKSGPLSDFDMFISRGWSVDDSKQTRGWFVQVWEEWQEVEALNRQVIKGYHDGRFQEMIPKAEEGLRRARATLGDAHHTVALYLNSLAALLVGTSRYDEAEPLFREAVTIDRKALPAGHPDIAVSINNLAALLNETGRYAEEEQLFREALAINREALPEGHPNVAWSLNNLAALLQNIGRYPESESMYSGALAIRRKALPEGHPDIATSLANLAGLLDTTGRYTEAEPLYREALAIRRKALREGHPDIALSLNNLAGLLKTTGRFAESESMYREALAINREALPGDHPFIAISLLNLASVLDATGRYAESELLYREAIGISKAAYNDQHPKLASLISSFGKFLLTTGRYDEAEQNLRKALAIRRKALTIGHPDIANSLDSLASLFLTTGHYTDAEPLYREALAIRHEALHVGHPDIASNTNNLAALLYTTGRYDEAEPMLREALQIAEQGGEPEVLWTVQGNLSAFYAVQQQSQLAIFYGKQAVNTLQSVRRNLRSAERSIQQTFAKSKEDYYKHLAELLMDQSRLSEAEQVLDMLKEQEYFDFIGRDPEAEVTLSQVGYAAQEQVQHERYAKASRNLAAIGKELQELERIDPQVRTAAEQQRIDALHAELEAAQQAYNAAIDEINDAFAQITDVKRQRELALKQIDTGRTALVAELGELSGSGVVLIHYLVLDDVLYILVTTPHVQVAHRVAVGAASLDDEIRALRHALQHAGVDPRPAAKVLYERLIRPIEADLSGADAHTLMLSLDGKLRYLPFATLYDGEHYLVERYALSVYTAAASDKLKDEPKPAAWTLAGFGVSQAQGEFGPLQAVPRELEEIVRRDEADTDGVVRGTIHLDEGFTESALKSSLWDGYPVLHLASHFKFQPSTENNPGTEDDSFLLLGDGKHLTLGQLRKGGYNFGKVDLLTLSACQTALGGEDAHGREVEGLGVTAQKKEARGVLATLWSVADPSTGPFMQAFYRKLMAGQLTKAEALRQVQLAFIRGEIGPEGQGTGARRDVGCLLNCDRSEGHEANAPSATADYSHPYYWAPFILMGNWL